MKILAIGDFHGRFPSKLQKRIKQINPDIIISTGDFANVDKIRNLIFKHWMNKNWVDVVGKKKAKQLEKECFDSGLKILKELNSLGIKNYIIWGNADFYKRDQYLESKKISPGCFEDKIKRMKNLVLIDRNKRKANGFDLIGHGGYVDVTDYIKYPMDKDKKKQKKRFERYKKYEFKLKKLFSDKKPKNFIFLTHYTPYRIFDKVKLRKSPMYGKHVGFEPYNKIIKKYQPLLCICGHMHEYQGMQKLGRTIIVNPGPAFEGKACLIKIEDNKIRKVKFIR